MAYYLFSDLSNEYDLDSLREFLRVYRSPDSVTPPDLNGEEHIHCFELHAYDIKEKGLENV